MLDPAGNEVPVQARALNHWPDGSVMFALVSFPASVDADASAQYTVEFGSRVMPSEFLGRVLTVNEQGGRIVVNTGPLQAALSTTRGTLVESATLDGTQMVSADEPWAALVTAEDGTEYSSAQGEVTETQIIEAGPLRAVIRRIGRHTAPNGATLLEFDMIQEFYLGSPTTRLSYVFTHKEDTETEKLRQVRLNMPCPWAGEGAGIARLGRGRVNLRQHSGLPPACLTATVTADGDEAEAGRTPDLRASTVGSR